MNEAAGDECAAVLGEPLAPVGLQALARQAEVRASLAVTPEEWRTLRCIQSPFFLPADAYLAILHVLRAYRAAA